MPILALQDAFERRLKDQITRGDCRDSGDHNEEAHLVRRAPEAAEPAGDKLPMKLVRATAIIVEIMPLRNLRTNDKPMGEIELADVMTTK